MTRRHVFDRFVILSFKVIYCRCEQRMSNVKNVIPHSALKTLSVVFKLETRLQFLYLIKETRECDYET